MVSNVFMTFAWYGHLKLQEMKVISNWPLYAVILFSWMIALAEYAFQIPANRIGFIGNGGPFSLMQLKVIQEVVTLIIFTIFTTVLFKGESLHWNHFAAFVCLVFAVYFVLVKPANLLFSCHILFHSFRIEHLEFSVFISIYKTCVKVGMGVGKTFGFLQSHHHEGGGVSICAHTIAGHYGGRQNVMLYRISCTRVDGMGIFLAVFIIIVSIVA